MRDFLGPHGKATIILMRSHFDTELPKLKDLKKLLNIPDGKYYKSGGRNSNVNAILCCGRCDRKCTRCN